MGTVISLRADEKQKKLISEYAKLHGESMSNFILETVLERIEDEIDLRDLEEAIKEYEAEPVTYTHEEVMKELGF